MISTWGPKSTRSSGLAGHSAGLAGLGRWPLEADRWEIALAVTESGLRLEVEGYELICL